MQVATGLARAAQDSHRFTCVTGQLQTLLQIYFNKNGNGFVIFDSLMHVCQYNNQHMKTTSPTSLL